MPTFKFNLTRSFKWNNTDGNSATVIYFSVNPDGLSFRQYDREIVRKFFSGRLVLLSILPQNLTTLSEKMIALIREGFNSWQKAGGGLIEFRETETLNNQTGGIAVVGCGRYAVQPPAVTFATIDNAAPIRLICFPQDIDTTQSLFPNTTNALHAGAWTYIKWLIRHEIGHGLGLEHLKQPMNQLLLASDEGCSATIMAYPIDSCATFSSCRRWYPDSYCYSSNSDKLRIGPTDQLNLQYLYGNSTAIQLENPLATDEMLRSFLNDAGSVAYKSVEAFFESCGLMFVGEMVKNIFQEKESLRARFFSVLAKLIYLLCIEGFEAKSGAFMTAWLLSSELLEIALSMPQLRAYSPIKHVVTGGLFAVKTVAHGLVTASTTLITGALGSVAGTGAAEALTTWRGIKSKAY